MSIQCGVTCLDCKVHAPGIGDGGFLGDPGLAKPGESPPSMEGPKPSFGYFYDALVGVGIRPYDLECFHAFLGAHDGHRLFLSSDHDDPKDWPAELLEFEAELETDESIDAWRLERTKLRPPSLSSAGVRRRTRAGITASWELRIPGLR